MVSFWAIRLGVFLFIRVLRVGEDRRFREAKKSFSKYLVWWTMSGLWVFLTTANALTLIINNITFNDTDVPATNTMFVLSSNANAGNIVGATSGASRTITTAPDQYVMGQDPLADNKDFETAGDNIIDFSESNPFGTL